MAEDLRALTAGSADMTAVATPYGVYQYVSPASGRLLGWDPDAMAGRHEGEFVHPEDLPSFRLARRSAAPDHTGTATYRFRCADGSYRWTEATYRRVETEGSTFVVTTIRDISDRRRSDAVDSRISDVGAPLGDVTP